MAQIESLLTDAFKGKGFQKIHELIQEKEVEPPQKYSESLFNQLDKALRKELDKNDFENVSLLLKCIQLYLKSDFQEGKSLFIEQGLVAKLVSWFERARTFVTVIDPNENKFLMLLLEDFFDCALVICKCSNEGKKELVNLFLPELGRLVAEASICCALHLEALRTLNSILDSVPREERKKFPLSEEMCSLTKDLAKTILEVGDYDLQVALSEALCRLMIKKWRDDLVHHWFEDNYLAEAFKEIKDREFETDCRKFLNLLNERLGDKRRVYSFPCISAFADMNEVKKPSDEKLEEFWIDFNTGSQSVTFYVDCDEGALWDSVRLSKENVNSYSVKEKDREKIVKIFMKIPTALNKTEATKVKLVFSAEFEILSVLRKVLGEEKLMKMVNSGVAMVTVGQQTDLEDANQENNSKTPSPGKKAKPSEKPLEEEPMDELMLKDDTSKRRNRKTSLAKKRAEGRKEVYDFENSDSSSHEKVSKAKGKILAQKISSQSQSYRKHLFSESNNENTSPGQSEKSWILDSQIQSAPKSVDYTRKRPRVRSKLKVLPVPSASSGSDYESRKKFHGTPGKISREEESTKRKDSDILSGTIIKKPKFSNLEKNHLPSEINHTPKKIPDSIEEDVETQKGHEMDDSIDDVFFPKLLHEELSDSGVVFAFESFIGHLKKLFWSRYKRIEINTQDALRSSEKNLSALLNQIHKCRLSKFETFQKIVVEELANLEKETQILAAMEKDALDFWNAQLLKLNTFCNQQKQRIESVDSALGETAKSFADAVQNTAYEHPVKKAEDVFIVPSD
ncbi:PREDICTED: synaptonemal complex protein 2-like [Pseudopodoces humilis]|uniref:synaptonemal complex protein 2-like n=1 Tax=Pseudopodoces humilis TaxID=181119 RepID=UPI0006B7A95C|nr:PREDICTED: synaptonemal complex protein 2-like [Pseudopodoces humilis]